MGRVFLMKLFLLGILVANSVYGQIISTSDKVDAETKLGFHGLVDLGYQRASGNVNYELSNVDADFRYGYDKHVGIFFTNRNYKRNQQQIFADSALYHLRYRYYVTPEWVLETYLQQNRNIFKALDNRQLFGAGVRREFGHAAFGISMLQESEVYTKDLGSVIDNRFNFFFSYSFWSDENKIFTADITSYYQPRIRKTSNAYVLFDPKDRRGLLELSLSMKLSLSLYYKITARNSYDQKPPADYIKKEDSLVINSLSYEF